MRQSEYFKELIPVCHPLKGSLFKQNAHAGGLYSRTGLRACHLESPPARAFALSWSGERRLQSATLMIALLLLTALVGVALAETEVSGEVSGEWSVEGSPFIVVDSTWVPEGDTLLLGAGAQVEFGEGQGLYVSGILNATGDEEDSVYIRLSDGVEHWRGLRFYGRNRTRWDYASIVIPDTAFVLDPGCSLTMNNCLVDAGYHTFAGLDYYGPRGCNFSFSHSMIRGGDFLLTSGGTLAASNSRFDFSGGDHDDEPALAGIGTGFRLTRCEVVGGLAPWDGYSIVDSCRFLRPPSGERIRVGIWGAIGQMLNTYIEGGAGISFSSGQVIPFVGNTVIGGFGGDYFSAQIADCDIRGPLDIGSNSGVISILNSVLSRRVLIRGAESLIIDSCFFVYDDRHPGFSHWGNGQDPHLTITRSVLNSRISIPGEVESVFDHNTIAFDSSGRYAISARPSSFTNNIITNARGGGQLFTSFENQLPGFQYNCVWGFDSYSGPPDDPVTELDSTNIVADPIIVWDGFIPNLSQESLCIDAGNPDYVPDPDGTRSDIGVRAYDQRLSFSHSDYHPYPQQMNINAFPNPFNSNLSISYSSPVIAPVRIALIDETGRNILQTLHTPGPSGVGLAVLNATSLPSGTYFILIRTDQFTGRISVNCLR